MIKVLIFLRRQEVDLPNEFDNSAVVVEILMKNWIIFIPVSFLPVYSSVLFQSVLKSTESKFNLLIQNAYLPQTRSKNCH